MLAEVTGYSVEVERCDEETLRYEESYNWRDVDYKLNQLLDDVDELRSEWRRTSGVSATEEYDRLKEMLNETRAYVQGRIQELDPTYCERRREYRYASPETREAIQYARQEGINYIALEQTLIGSDIVDAIEYISRRGLASMKYDATRRAIHEHCEVSGTWEKRF